MKHEMPPDKGRIQSLLLEGEVEDAIDQLIEHLKTSNAKELTDAILLKNSFEEAKRQYFIQSIISHDDFGRWRNKVIVGINTLLVRVEDSTVANERIGSKPGFGKKNWLLIIGTAIVLTMLFLTFKQLFYSATMNQSNKQLMLQTDDDSTKVVQPTTLPTRKNNPINNEQNSPASFQNRQVEGEKSYSNSPKCEVYSDKLYFRSSASATSKRVDIAEKKAILGAKSQIAAAINERVDRVTEQVLEEQESDLKSSTTTTFREKTTTLVNELLSGCQIICKNEITENGGYRIFVAVEMPKKVVTEALDKAFTVNYQIKDFNHRFQNL